jgi:hypothetical protein
MFPFSHPGGAAAMHRSSIESQLLTACEIKVIETLIINLPQSSPVLPTQLVRIVEVFDVRFEAAS